MSKKKHIIDFPKGKGRYWYLFWIGKVKYNKQRKVDFYNKMMPDESWYNNIDYNNWVVKLFQSHSYQNMTQDDILSYKTSNQKLITINQDVYRKLFKEYRENPNKNMLGVDILETQDGKTSNGLREIWKSIIKIGSKKIIIFQKLTLINNLHNILNYNFKKQHQFFDTF